MNDTYAHAADGGIVCPACGSHDIEGLAPNFEVGAIYQRMGCNICHAEWTDEYHLQGYGALEDANGNAIVPPPVPCWPCIVLEVLVGSALITAVFYLFAT